MKQRETLLDNEVPLGPGFGKNRKRIHFQRLAQDGGKMLLQQPA